MSEVVTRRPATSTSTKVTPTRRNENNNATSPNLTSQPHNARVTRVDVLPTPPQTSPIPSPTSTTSEGEADYVVISRRPSHSSIIHQPSTSISSPSHTTSSTSTSTSTSTPTLTQYAQHSDYVSMYPVLSSIPGGIAIPMQQFVRDDLYVPTAPLASSDISLLPSISTSTSTSTSPTSTSTITTHTQHIPIHPVTGQRLSPQQLALAKEIQDRNMAYFACVAEARKEFEKKEAEIRALKESIQHSSRPHTSSTSTSSHRDTITRRKLLSILHDQGMRNDENRMQAFVRHEVVEGDELFGLAIKYGTTPEAIRQYNRRVIFDYLDNVQGEWLHIPIDAHLLTIPSSHYTPEPTKPEETEAKRQAAVVNRQFYLIRSFMDLANDYYYKYLHQYNQTHGINQHRDRTVMSSRDITPAIINPVVDEDLYHVISPSRPLTDKERAKSQAKRELDAKNAAKQQQKLLQLKATADDIVTEGEAKFYLDENDWNMTRAMASWCDDRNWEQQQHRDMIARSQGNVSTINMTTPLESMFTRESAARQARITQSRSAILNIQNMTLASAAYHRLEDDDEAMAKDEAEARARLALSPPKGVRRYGDVTVTQR